MRNCLQHIFEPRHVLGTPRFGDKHVATAGALVVLGTTMGVLGDVESEKAWASTEESLESLVECIWDHIGSTGRWI